MTDRLFPVAPLPEPDAPLSPDARRTRRQRDLIAAGIHPATRQPIIEGTGLTCQTCVHHVWGDWHNRTYHKCDKHILGKTHSAASDIRVSWPACKLHNQAPTEDTNGRTNT